MGRYPGATVRVDPGYLLLRGARTAARLHIGRALWRSIGEPTSVTLERRGATVAITPGDERRVYVRRYLEPRVSLGRARREELGLEVAAYTAHVDGEAIVLDGVIADPAISPPPPAISPISHAPLRVPADASDTGDNTMHKKPRRRGKRSDRPTE